MSVILSRVFLNPAHPEVVRWLSNFNHLHGALWKLFPDVPKDGDARARTCILHHIHLDAALGRIELLVQAKPEPRWEGWDDRIFAAEPQSKVVPAALVAAGATLRFRLVGSACSRICKWQGKQTKPVQYYHAPDDLQRWVTTRMAAAGAEIQGAALSTVLPRRAPPKGYHPNAVQFDGLLRVIDAPRLVTALETGLGRARSYGCGLLLLARV